MAVKDKGSSPLTFDLRRDLLDQVENYQRKAGLRSKSEVIRDAIESFDYSTFEKKSHPHRQISVRLPSAQKRNLLKVAKQKKASLGELLRAALESLPENPVKAVAEDKAPSATSKSPKLKKAAAKAPAKKAAPKAASKPAKTPAKKSAPKAVKMPASRKSAPTGAAGKAPARKTVAPKRAVARKASTPKATGRVTAAKKPAAKKAAGRKK